MALAFIDQTKPAIRLQIRPADTAVRDSERFEILVTLPAERYAASHRQVQVQDIDDDEPTWEDAEWQ